MGEILRWYAGLTEGDEQFGGICHCSLRLQGGMVGVEDDDQLWRSGRAAIAGCHCSVLWLGKGGRGAVQGVMNMNIIV